MAIRFEEDKGDRKKPEPKPQLAKVSSDGQAATVAEEQKATKTPSELPFAKPVRPEKRPRKAPR